MARPIDRAAAALAAGRLVVVPTDTLLGLAARADDRSAVDRLQRAKGRSAAQLLSAAVSSVEELERLAVLSPAARAFVRRRLPGPYTVLLKPSPAARRRLAPAVAGAGRIGLRVPDHPVVRELARRVGPIVATSANRHGERPARTAAEARATFGRAVHVYLSARPAPSGRPSELVDLAGATPRTVPRR